MIKLFKITPEYTLLTVAFLITVLFVPITSHALTLTSSSNNVGLNAGLVGWWTFDGKDVVNGVARDKSGSANHGTLVSISTSTFYTTGKIGQGFKFDGVNDTVNIATNMFANRTEFSLMVWTKKTKGTTGSVFSSSNGGPYWRFTSATTILHYIEKSDCTGSSRGVAYPDDGKFHYIGFTVSTAGLVRFYVDGVVVDSYTYPSWNYACADATDWRSIGSYAVSNYFNGLLDDVRIYNRALSATEVIQLYNQGSAAKQGVAQKVTATSTCSTGLSCGLVGYWSFDGKDVVNGRALDKSGSGNHGTLTNISTSTFYTTGKIGQGFRFDGVDDKVLFSSQAMTQMTISAWVYPRSYPVTFPRIIDMPGYVVTMDQDTTSGHNAASFNCSVIYSTNGGYDTPTNSVVLNKWTHVVCTYDGSSIANLPKIYLNGVSQTLTTITTQVGTQTSNSGTGYIGSRSANDRQFNGLLDDVRIYNRALSATEVIQLYNQGSAAKQGVAQKVTATSTCSTGLSCGLVGYWSFDGKDVVNGVARDKSGSNNHGNLVNIATSTFYVPGKIGQGFRFDGSNDYVSVPDSTSLDLSTSATVSIWFRRSFPVTSKRIMVGKWSGAGSRSYVLLLDTDSRFYWVVSSDGTASTAYFTSTLSNTSTQWNNLVGVYNGTTLSIYLNGVSLAGAITGAVPSSIFNSASAVEIGRYTTNSYSNGSLDDVRIYNRALSANEVMQLYNQRK